MRLDGHGARRDVGRDAVEDERIVVEFHAELCMRIDDGRVFQVLEQFLLCGDTALELQLNSCSVRENPVNLLMRQNLRLVVLGLDGKRHLVCRTRGVGSGNDGGRLAGCQLCIENCRRYSDTLLTAGLSYLVETGTVEQFCIDRRHLLRDDSRAIVFDNHAEDVLFDTANRD